MTGSSKLECLTSINSLLHLFNDLLLFLREAEVLSSFSLQLCGHPTIENQTEHEWLAERGLSCEQKHRLQQLLVNLRNSTGSWETQLTEDIASDLILSFPEAPVSTESTHNTSSVLPALSSLDHQLNTEPVLNFTEAFETPETPADNHSSDSADPDDLFSDKEEDIEETENKPVVPNKSSLCCHLCGRSYSTKAHLRRHIAAHAGARSHECKECGRRYAAKHGLASHMLREHGKGHAFSCVECGKQFAVRQELEKHSASHAINKPFQCDVCQRTFSQKVTRDAHLALHTGVFPYSCETCGKGFALQAKLRAHELIHGPPRFHCELCGHKFARRDCLRQHLKRHTDHKPWSCASCGRAFRTSYALSSHEQVHSEGARFVCEECGAKFRQKSSLILHLRRHSQSDLHACQQCDKTYAKKYDLTRHILSHAKVRAFLCEACGKDFKSAGDLAEHRRRLHMDTDQKKPRSQPSANQRKEFPCVSCPKVFKTRSRLSTHNRQCHSHLQPRHECSTCGKRFHRSDVLRNHERVHSGEKPFACEHCPKRFASRTNLIAHAVVHAPTPPTSCMFNCELCPRTYKRASSLAAHRRKHHEPQSQEATTEDLSCPVCQRTFPSKSALGGHLRSHPSEERPFACVLCNRRYKKRKHWREHVQKSHSDLTELSVDNFRQQETTYSQQSYGVITQQEPAPQASFVETFNIVPDDALQLLEQLTEAPRDSQNFLLSTEHDNQNQSFLLDAGIQSDNQIQSLSIQNNQITAQMQLAGLDTTSNQLHTLSEQIQNAANDIPLADQIKRLESDLASQLPSGNPLTGHILDSRQPLDHMEASQSLLLLLGDPPPNSQSPSLMQSLF